MVVDARRVERHPFGTRYVVSCGHFATRSVRRSSQEQPETDRGIARRCAAGDVVSSWPRRPVRRRRVPARRSGGRDAAGRGRRARRSIDAGNGRGRAAEGASLRRLTVTGGAPGYMMIPPTCVTRGRRSSTVRDCIVESIMLAGGDGHVVTGNVIAGGKVWLVGTTDCEMRGNYQHGLRWGAGIEVQGRRRPRHRRERVPRRPLRDQVRRHDRRAHRAQPLRDPLVRHPCAQRAGHGASSQPGVAHDARGERRGRRAATRREASSPSTATAAWSSRAAPTRHRRRRLVVPRLPGRRVRVGRAARSRSRRRNQRTARPRDRHRPGARSRRQRLDGDVWQAPT